MTYETPYPPTVAGENLAAEQGPTRQARLGAVQAFLTGLRLALRCWPVLLLMLLGTLLTAGALALLPALNLLELIRQPVIAEIADGLDTWQLVDLVAYLANLPGSGSAPSESLRMGMLSLLVMALALPVLGGIVSAFLYGGVLLTYREALTYPEALTGSGDLMPHETPSPFRFRRFLWGCWRWFGTFLLLGLIQALLFLFLLVPIIVVGWTLLVQAGSAGSWVSAGLVLLGLLFWLMLFETARVRIVAADRRNPFFGLGQAFGLLFGRPLDWIAFYLLALLVLAAVHAVYRLVILPVLPVGVLPLALLVQQSYILARLFTQALRLAGLSAMEP